MRRGKREPEIASNNYLVQLEFINKDDIQEKK